jgi:hypothetical protein
MRREKRDNSALVRALVVALASLGTGADALPIPLFASAALREVGEGPCSPSRDEERDETPDEASDLACPLFAVARSGRSSPSSGQRLSTSWLAWEPVVGRDPLTSRRTASPVSAPKPLSVALCRLTC